MGRTIPTFTRYLEEELSTWKDFRRALGKEDREVLDRLFRYAKRHIAEASCAARPVPFDALVMTVLIEQQKEIERLQKTSPPNPLSVIRRGGIKTPPLHIVERGPGGEVLEGEVLGSKV